MIFEKFEIIVNIIVIICLITYLLKNVYLYKYFIKNKKSYEKIVLNVYNVFFILPVILESYTYANRLYQGLILYDYIDLFDIAPFIMVIDAIFLTMLSRYKIQNKVFKLIFGETILEIVVISFIFFINYIINYI